MSEHGREALRILQQRQSRLRAGLAAVLLIATCLFALLLSWLAQATPLTPLLMVKVSFIALVIVYGIGVGVAAIYARWIRVHREPALRAIETERQ
jgi:hypothetical protein